MVYLHNRSITALRKPPATHTFLQFLKHFNIGYSRLTQVAKKNIEAVLIAAENENGFNKKISTDALHSCHVRFQFREWRDNSFKIKNYENNAADLIAECISSHASGKNHTDQ
jgi:hypothetical protein